MPPNYDENEDETDLMRAPETPETAPTSEANLEDAFQSLFKTSASGTGEEELLRIASTFSLQLSAGQIKALLYLEWAAEQETEIKQKQIRGFISRWLELKQHNNSDQFVMHALDSISLRKFIGENAFKIDIAK